MGDVGGSRSLVRKPSSAASLAGARAAAPVAAALRSRAHDLALSTFTQQSYSGLCSGQDVRWSSRSATLEISASTCSGSGRQDGSGFPTTVLTCARSRQVRRAILLPSASFTQVGPRSQLCEGSGSVELPTPAGDLRRARGCRRWCARKLRIHDSSRPFVSICRHPPSAGQQ